MTLLSALERHYARLAEQNDIQRPGWSFERVGFALVLARNGAVLACEDLREGRSRTGAEPRLEVPAPVKRTVEIRPNLFWDKSAYVLGRSARASPRTATEHAAFRALHLPLLAGSRDPGLVALRLFLTRWRPDAFDAPPFSVAMLDSNLVFRLAGDPVFLHQRAAAQPLVERHAVAHLPPAGCLVTGRIAPIRRLHPAIKGVEGAQSSGAALVSFNLDSATSFGHVQGANAPVSETAAFRYGAALNRLLDPARHNRLPRCIGDTTIAFWAEAERMPAQLAERWFAEAIAPPFTELDSQDLDADSPSDALPSLPPIDPRIPGDAPFHVLGLAPNASRLSVRFWISEPFDIIVRRLRIHADAIALMPAPWRVATPSLARLLLKTTAPLERFDAIPAGLAGEVLRAILGGTALPASWLNAVLSRLRADGDPTTGWHAAVIRGLLARVPGRDVPPPALDRDSPSVPYQLGRLFALIETAQATAVGRRTALLGQRYFGPASAAPGRIFPLLLQRVPYDLDRLRGHGAAAALESELAEVMARLPPTLPPALAPEDAGRFAIGYYHQRRARGPATAAHTLPAAAGASRA